MSRYYLGDGIFNKQRILEIPEDPPPCMMCGDPVESPSTAGPLVCGRCDCGLNRDGKPLSWQEEKARDKHIREYLKRYEVTDE